MWSIRTGRCSSSTWRRASVGWRCLNKKSTKAAWPRHRAANDRLARLAPRGIPRETFSGGAMSEDSKTVFKLVAGALCVSAVLVSVPLLAVPALIGFWIWRSVKKRRSRPSKKELAAAAREVGATSGGADGSAWRYSCSRFELAIDFDRDQAVLR